MYRVETCCNFAVLFEIRFSFVVLGEFGNDECTAVSRIYSEGKIIIVIYIYIFGSVSEKMKSGYIYKKLYKCFTFELLKLHNGLSNQLRISNTSCHNTSL